MKELIDLYPKGSKILLIGTFPPPMGGVSSHVYRAFKLLKKSNFKVKVFDNSKRYFASPIKLLYLFIQILFGPYTIVHLHTTRKNIIRTVLFANNIKTFQLFFTDHNPRLFVNKNPSDINFYKLFFSRLDLLIAVGNNIISNYNKYEVKIPTNHIVLNAFLPPDTDDEESIRSTYSSEILYFIKNSNPLLVANAFKLIIVDGIDMYGLDMCIHLTHKLKEKYPEIGFLFALPDASENIEYLKKCEDHIAGLGIEKNFFIIKTPLEIWPIFKDANLMVRPTYSDGYGISIDEALYFNCPSVASDVCKRHPEAIVFKNRDQNDFYQKCYTVLKKQYHK